MMDIEAPVSRLVDRAALADLIVHYFLASDGDHLRTIRESFAESGNFAVSGSVLGIEAQGVVDFIVDQRRHMGLTLHTPSYAPFTFETHEKVKGLVGSISNCCSPAASPLAPFDNGTNVSAWTVAGASAPGTYGPSTSRLGARSPRRSNRTRRSVGRARRLRPPTFLCTHPGFCPSGGLLRVPTMKDKI